MHLLAFFMSYREPSWKNTIPRTCRFLRGSISYSHRCIITSVALQGSVPGAGYISYLSWCKGRFSPETHLTFHFACVSSLLRWLNKIRKILLHPPVWLLVPPSRACLVLIKNGKDRLATDQSHSHKLGRFVQDRLLRQLAPHPNTHRCTQEVTRSYGQKERP